MSTQAIGFVFVGLLAGGVNVVSRILFNYVVPYEVAIVLAFPAALTVAFVLNRWLVFRATEGEASTQYAKFAMVNILALAQVWLVSVGLARVLFPLVGFTWHAETIAHAVGVASPIVTSFVAYKYFVFARPAGVAGERST